MVVPDTRPRGGPTSAWTNSHAADPGKTHIRHGSSPILEIQGRLPVSPPQTALAPSARSTPLPTFRQAADVGYHAISSLGRHHRVGNVAELGVRVIHHEADHDRE